MRPEDDWQSYVLDKPHLVTYQLDIHLLAEKKITVGRLGEFNFPAGRYIYTGSAKRNLASRINRHLSKDKKLRWHIDYLFASRETRIININFSAQDECSLNKQSEGEILVKGFGASDCRSGCGSHLKYLGVIL